MLANFNRPALAPLPLQQQRGSSPVPKAQTSAASWPGSPLSTQGASHLAQRREAQQVPVIHLADTLRSLGSRLG